MIRKDAAELIFPDRPTRALVVGDLMLDRYLEGRVNRISPEAPVPVVSLEDEWCRAGGAGNVAASLAGLGCEVTVLGVVGCDREAELLRRALSESGVREALLIESAANRTITKTRVVSLGHHQLLRLDQDGDRAGFLACGATIEARAVELIEAHDVVVLSDYNKGTLAAGVLRGVIERCRERSTPCAIDPKLADFSQYRGAWVLTPNLHEAEQALGRRLFGDGEVSAGCRELRERLGLEAMLITRGPEGMTLSTSEGESHFPAVVREVSDVTGAGDTVMAVLARGLGRREDLREACRLASIAAGIAVSQPGAYVVRADELEAARRGRSPKIVDWEEARRRLDRERRLGRDIVFTNGCFDILHAGHLASLEQARGCGHFLVVGLNSDGSIRANKGPARPILTESHRAALLAGLECVDLVVVFDEETPERLIRHLEPKVLVKGGDYTIGQIVGADLVQSWGGRVVTIPLVAGLSTTSILAEARRGPHAPLGGVNAMVGRER